jgi:hypothetical protein
MVWGIEPDVTREGCSIPITLIREREREGTKIKKREGQKQKREQDRKREGEKERDNLTSPTVTLLICSFLSDGLGYRSRPDPQRLLYPHHTH